MGNDLGSVGWQLGVVGLLCASGIGAFWSAKRYWYWLSQKIGQPSKWVAISSVVIGVAIFVFLAVFLGFVIDNTSSV
jgi:threonine/homoserine efflux transporter RhtA